MTLREDHERRPMWVTPSGIVFLEASSPFFTQAYDFVIAIAEPVSRPEFVHEYAINAYSLFAAASIGLSTEDILKGLDLFSKTQLDDYLIDFIKKHTERCGKVKLLLDKGKYFVESQFSAVLKELLQVRQIRDSRIDLLEGTSYKNRDAASGFLKTTIVSTTVRLGGDDTGIEVNQSAAMGLEPESLDAEEVKIVYSFEIDPSKVEQVRKSCHDLGYPTLEEYEFRKDTDTHNLPMSLRPIAKIRGYQEKSLSKMFGNGRARSGIIVLPCGAGKTLVGITATSTVRKNTLVLCNTGVSADQWKKQYQKWANIPDKNICVFTSSVKDELPTGEAVILITTYNMIAFSGRRSEKAMVTLREIASREWGLIVLDEVHVAPAKTFRTCLSLTKSRCKLGLTATLLREDDLIDDLFFLIGPKLYEANWLGLQKAGYLATVQCIEIRCPMTPEFYRQYLRSDMRKQQLLYVMNPNKFRACQHLIEWHESRGDKILVFSDIIYALEKYAKDLKKPFLHGKTSDRERLEFLSHLQYDDDVNTLFISKVCLLLIFVDILGWRYLN
jgi:DNA excision repair protein ERCC-3